MDLWAKTIQGEKVSEVDERVWYPSVRQVYKLLIAVFVLTLIAGGVLGQSLGHGGALICYLLFVLIPPLLIIKRAGSPFRRILRLRHIDLRLALACLVMAFPLGLLMSEVDNLTRRVVPMPEFWQFMREETFSWHGPTDFLLLALWAVLMGPICEEILFRGYTLSGFQTRYGSIKGVAFSAVVFGLFHADPWIFLPTVMMGLLFGFLVLKTGSIYPAMLVHGANNLLFTIGIGVRRLRDVAWLHEGLLPVPILIACLITFGATVVWVLRTTGQSTLEEKTQRVREC